MNIKKLNKENIRDLPFWIAAVAAGLVAVLYARLFKFAETQFLTLFGDHPYWILGVTPLGFTLAWFLVYKFGPNAKGSGIPQVLACVDLSQEPAVPRTAIQNLLSLRITVIKILSSFITVICGGAIGREGPTIQISAYIFHAIGERFNKVWKNQHQDVFFISGGAAGIAAAFNTPLGGIVYAIEELSKTSFHRFRTSLFTAVIISGVVAQVLSGPYLFIGDPKVLATSSNILVYALIVGIASGLGGCFFGRALLLTTKIRRKIKNPYGLASLAFILGLMMACMIVFLNPNSATSGKELILQYLFDNKASSFDLVLIRFFSPILTYFGGAAGGIFSPALSAGASIGARLGDLVSQADRNTFIILGMIGFLSGFTGAPFTSFVLVLEMTDRHAIVFPMMVTAMTAHVISQLLYQTPFYELVKEFFIEEEHSKIKKPA